MSFMNLLMWLYYIVPLAAAAAALVLGIIVTASKIKQTKILGISVSLSALNAIVSGVYNLFAVFAGSEVLARLADARSVLAYIVVFACAFCTCFYIHRNYLKKYIYFPLLLIPLAGSIVNVVIVGVFNRMNSGADAGSVVIYRIGMAQNIHSLIINIAVSLIVIIVFYKHRKIEKYIPHYYIIETISLAWHCIGSGLYIIFYAMLASSAAVHGYAEYSSTDTVQLLLVFQAIIGALIGLIFPIYLLVRVRRASREDEESLPSRDGGEEPDLVLDGEIDMPSTEETEFSQPDEPS